MFLYLMRITKALFFSFKLSHFLADFFYHLNNVTFYFLPKIRQIIHRMRRGEQPSDAEDAFM